MSTAKLYTFMLNKTDTIWLEEKNPKFSTKSPTHMHYLPDPNLDPK